MKKIMALSAALLIMISMLTGCAGVTLNFTGVSPFRNIRDEGTIDTLDKTVSDFAEENGASVSVGVMNGKKTRFINTSPDMGEHTLVPIGTMTTMFTGMLVSNFEQNRWLDRNQYVDEWIKMPVPVPENSGERLKIWQLACGVSGLGEADTFGKDYFTAGMMYNQLDEVKFDFPAGDRIQESSLGTALLSECLRQSYNMNANLVNLVNNQVIGKMDLRDSSFGKGDSLAAYDGYESTVYDLLKVAGYCGGMLLRDEGGANTVNGALEEVWHDEENTLSLAFNIDKAEGGNVYYKMAETDEGCVFMAFSPESGTGVSASADKSCDLESLCRELMDIVNPR